MAVSLRKQEQYQVVISIWGVIYKSLPMTISQCEQAEKQARETHPGLNISIVSAEHAFVAQVVTRNEMMQTLGEMEAANPNAFRTEETKPVRIKLSYKNHTLAAIMLKLKEELRDGMEMHIKVMEDTPNKWAIHTAEHYYYTVHGIVKSVCESNGIVFKAAGTGSPDWDVFCSA